MNRKDIKMKKTISSIIVTALFANTIAYALLPDETPGSRYGTGSTCCNFKTITVFDYPYNWPEVYEEIEDGWTYTWGISQKEKIQTGNLIGKQEVETDRKRDERTQKQSKIHMVDGLCELE